MIREDFSARGKFQDLGRWYVTRFVDGVSNTLAPGTSILDAGAGEGVYKSKFAHCDYKAIDLAVGEGRWDYSHLDYIAPLHDMPITSETFDAVLCTEVLEHLEWPRASVEEMFRVIKPGGKLYITAPMSHAEHQIPYDFFRYTSYGLRSICRQAGFREVIVSPFGGQWARWAYEAPRALALVRGLRSSSGQLSALGMLLSPIRIFLVVLIRLMQVVFLFVDRLDTTKSFPFGWSCVATK